MDDHQILAFRAGRHGLDRRRRALVDGVRIPASDFNRDGALVAVAARVDRVTRHEYDEAVDDGTIVVGHSLRGALHAMAPSDVPVAGRALIAHDPEELLAQLGDQIEKILVTQKIDPRDALKEVSDAARAALRTGRRLDRMGLHAELRGRVTAELLPWCKSCASHHVPPMLWRYALVEIGSRRDSTGHYRSARRQKAPDAGAAARLFLGAYDPSTVKEFAGWAGLASSHAQRIWDSIADELHEVTAGRTPTAVLTKDRGALTSPVETPGVRLLPPGDPFLHTANRRALVTDRDLAKRLFRPVASPGAILIDGRLAGLWRSRTTRKKLHIEIESLRRIRRSALDEEAGRVAEAKGAADLAITLG